MTDEKEPTPQTEPSVWDYLASKIQFWKKEWKNNGEPKKEALEDLETDQKEVFKEVLQEQRQLSKVPSFPWLTLAAIVLSLMAQLSLQPSPSRTFVPGFLFYGIALVCLIVAYTRKEWSLLRLRSEDDDTISTTFRWDYLLISIVLAIFAFLLFGSGEFGFLNTSLWVLSLVFVFLAFWRWQTENGHYLRKLFQLFKKKGWGIRISRYALIVLAVIAVILFFNFHRLDSVPPEMLSDQAEKLMDINNVLHGHFPIYFPRNTGREVIHFYLTAAYMAIFNLEVSFLNLKTVAVFANLVTLLFIYLLGKEVGNKWVGLFAVMFAGMAYWPVVFTRLALRIPYYPLFVAPVMYFMVRGLRRQNINDILWTGLFLGVGLHGYTPFRIVPIFVVLGILIFLLHKNPRSRWMQSLFALTLIVIVSLIVFIPLLRYWLADPELFSYRAFSRLTTIETEFPAPPLVIFFQNFWKASVMFFWDNGSIWAHSVPGHPALEVVSAAFYFLGIVSLIFRYVRKRDWRDLYLLVSIPMLLMPSILSLAFPSENPSLNRTAGAVVPVFVVVGVAFESAVRTFWMRLRGWLGKSILIILVILLVLWSAANNYDLVFNQYFTIYQQSSWNTSEIGRIAELFISTLGSPETTYVVGYPHWVDSRLVAINAGYPGMDFAIFTEQMEQIPETADEPQAKLFFLNVNDGENMQLLLETYTNGILQQYDSKVENKDFMIFFVPPAQGVPAQ
jgi:hypothetical protein